jgi:hypothetical protein
MTIRYPVWKRAAGALAAALVLLPLLCSPLGAQESASIAAPARLFVPAPAPAAREAGFAPAQAQPPERLKHSKAAMARHEIARLLADSELGHRHARQADAQLRKIEKEERERGNTRGASRLALQRGRVLAEMLDDPAAAAEAFADAVVDDEDNKEAARALHAVLERTHRGASARPVTPPGRRP